MPDFPDLISDYMHYREVRGLQPSPKTAHLLSQFTTSLPTDRDDQLFFTATEALEWANSPIDAHPAWPAMRLSVVRQFALYLAGMDIPVAIPPTRQLPTGSSRAVPFIYTDEEIAALITAAYRLSTPLRAATMATLTGLITVTGMRIGEAVNLDIGDIDSDHGTVLIRHAKFDRERVVCLSPSTITAISTYLALPIRQQFGTQTASPLFVSTRGIRPGMRTIYDAWHRMCAAAGITARAGARPRIHDLRHTFATNTMIDAYRLGNDPAATLSVLAIWLGHSSPAYTYWYLEAVPGLAASTAELIETGEFS